MEYSYKADNGLTEEVIREISAKKEEPEWMLEKRLQALEIYNHMDFPEWAPDISELDMDHIDTYIAKTDMKAKWKTCRRISGTHSIVSAFLKQKKSLADVGAQYDSEVVYHNIQKELEEQGVIYVDFETAVKEYPDLIKPYFGKLITPNCTINLLHCTMLCGPAALSFTFQRAFTYACRCRVISASMRLVRDSSNIL